MVFTLLLLIMWKEELSLKNLAGRKGGKMGHPWKAAYLHAKSGLFLYLTQAWRKS